MCEVSTSRRHHHGDLRVARRAGVSPTAPYRHYEDKEALLAALATHGFARLADRLGEGRIAHRETDRRRVRTGVA